MKKISLLDRLSLERALRMILDFVLALVDKFKKETPGEKKRKPWWRRRDE